MRNDSFVVLVDDIDTDSGHYATGDVLHLDKLTALVQEINAPVACVICPTFDAACEWSDIGEQEQFA